MPIDTEQWRAQTGLFCASRVLLQPPRCKQPQPKVQADTLSLNIEFSLAVLLVMMRTGIVYASRTLQLLWSVTCHASCLLSSIVRLSCRRLRGVSVLLALCLVVVQMLLIMSGDVEENPGPPKIHVPSLGPDSLNDVHKELWDISAKWYDIGLELRLQTGVLENIRYQNPDAPTCLREMLFQWLKKVDLPPTWEELACALESRTVGQHWLAEQLRRKYCKTEGAAVSVAVGTKRSSPSIPPHSKKVKPAEPLPVSVAGGTKRSSLSIPPHSKKVKPAEPLPGGSVGQTVAATGDLAHRPPLNYPTYSPMMLGPHRDGSVGQTVAAAGDLTYQHLSPQFTFLPESLGRTMMPGRPMTGHELLTVNDLYDVFLELHGVRAKWHYLGVSLGVNESTLEAIGDMFHDSGDCLQGMLRYWLTHYLPWWSVIVAALRMPIMDEPRLAHILEAKYCSGYHSRIHVEDRGDLLYMRQNPFISHPSSPITPFSNIQVLQDGTVRLVPAGMDISAPGANYPNPPTNPNELFPTEQQHDLLSGRAQTRRLEQQQQQLEVFHNRQARELFDKALEKGYVLCHIDKCVMMGNAGAGKTHVMYRLFNKDPPAIRSSTAVAEAPIRAISRTIIGAVKRSVDWFEVSSEKLMEMLAQAVQAGVPMEGEEREQQPVIEDGSPTSSLRPPPSSNGSARQQTEDVASASKESEPQSLNFESPEALMKPLAEQVSPSSEEIIKMLETVPGSKRFLEIRWVHFIDTGGQPQFHELFSSFVKNATAAVYVIKLSERLDENPVIEYYQSGQPCGSACLSALSTDEILQHCVQTVHSQMIPSSIERGSTFIVVGTHRDLEHTCTEKRAEKNKKLLEILQPIVRKSLVFCGTSMEEVIFPINAKEPEAEDYEIAASIRKLISDKGLPPFKIPVGWFLLEQDIRKFATKQGRGVVSKAECREIAARLKINDESLEAALAYLHKLNISLYYPNFLPEVVFCESQVLFDKITELVAFSYQLRCQSSSRKAFEGIWLCFRDEGIVTRDLLKQQRFSKHYVPGFFTPDELLHLLKCLLIVAPITNTSYFMPSLLPSISKEDVKKHRLSTTSTVAPLLIHFSDGCAPNGLFCAFVVYLLSSCGWKIAKHSSTPSCIACNCIEFQPPVPGLATLINSYTHFEVHLNIPKQLYPSFCRKAYQDIRCGLEKAIELLNCDSPGSTVSYSLAFFCHCREPAHPATVYSTDDGQKFATCTANTQKYYQLEWRQMVWLEDTKTPAVGTICQGSVEALSQSETELEESDMAEISKYLIKLDKPHLLNLGMVFGLSFPKLRSLQDSPAFMNTLVAGWILKQDYVIEKGLWPTWRNLVVGLKDERVGQTGLANDIARDKRIDL